MNKYIGQQFAALRYEKNILVVEETTSAGKMCIRDRDNMYFLSLFHKDIYCFKKQLVYTGGISFFPK